MGKWSNSISSCSSSNRRRDRVATGIRRLLVANRGEIALRTIRAAHALGMEAVLAATAADKDSLAARSADRVVVIGPAQARLSYLNAALLVHAAKATGCDALHPGYGFLSERAELAELCAENGLTFVGPSADTIRRVGDKLAARTLAKAAGIPLVPGSAGLSSVEEALKVAGEIGYPVVTKASAGGGGRGMLVARDSATLAAGFAKASGEAREAFGDGTLYLERYVEQARHVEVQIMGDGVGGIVHFGERDCSVQRRYQKMVEEAPAAILPPELRLRLHRAAIDLLARVSYRNAGTVEFLYDLDRQTLYFIEVNARIQVEHPVSEVLFGVDLVQLQLKVAAGEALDLQPSARTDVHAIELRIIAEDPDHDFRPSPGRITRWRAPEGDGIRLDTAMHEGALVAPFYDSMIAKLIVHGKNRNAALGRLSDALNDFRIEGVSTNLGLLRALVMHPDYVANRMTTCWLEQTFLPTHAGRKGSDHGTHRIS
jgi:acetyl-CoA carboxylase biotin carboxylase subunit